MFSNVTESRWEKLISDLGGNEYDHIYVDVSTEHNYADVQFTLGTETYGGSVNGEHCIGYEEDSYFFILTDTGVVETDLDFTDKGYRLIDELITEVRNTMTF